MQIQVEIPPISKVDNRIWFKAVNVDSKLSWQARVLGTNRERLIDLDYRGSAHYVGKVRIYGTVPAKTAVRSAEASLLSQLKRELESDVRESLEKLEKERRVDELVAWGPAEQAVSLPEEQLKELKGAIFNDDLEALKVTLKNNPSLFKVRDNLERTLLHEAADSGSIRVVQWMTENGADPKAVDRFLRPAWQVALERRCLLGSRKALQDPEARRLREQNRKVLSHLLDQDPVLDARDVHGSTSLHIVGRWTPDLEVAGWLLQKGTPVDLQDSRGRTALSYAVEEEKLDYVSWLLKNGADPTAVDFEGKSPKDYADSEEARESLR